MTAGLHTVHVRVNDAATGQPTPVRIRLTDAAGNYYPPLGRLAQFATGRGQDVGGNLLLFEGQHAYIDGVCEVPLPAGTIRAELWKGPEYRPKTVEVELPAGKLALRLSVERWTNLREGGWYSGDTRVHFLSPRAALLEAAAEDLAVVNVLAFENTILDAVGRPVPSIPNILDYSGQGPAAEAPGHLVAVNTHNVHHVLGSLGLLHTHRVVYPLTFGGERRRDDWTLRDWCGQCHRKGGLVVWTQRIQEARGRRLGETLADLILGEVDAYEIAWFYEKVPFDALADWYRLLNCGFRVPLTGASGKEHNGQVVGQPRTYARLQPDEPLTYRAWIEAVRAGRTFVTDGPLLSFTVNDQHPGATIDLASPGQVLRVRAGARSVVPFEQLELLLNGDVIATASATDDSGAAVIELELPVAESAWIAARCGGSHFAHSSPVYVRVAGQAPRADRAACQRFIDHLDRMLRWVTRKARCPTEKHRAALADVFNAARAELLRR
jgi:hypothetical protein